MAMIAPKSVQHYLDGLTADRRAALEKLRQQIKSVVPTCEECISYAMPAFRVEGGVFAGFVATKAGCSYFPFSGRTLETVASELAGYSRTKGALHFDPKRGLPTPLLRKLVAARRGEIAAKASKQKPAKKAPSAKKPAKLAKKPGAKKKPTRKIATAR